MNIKNNINQIKQLLIPGCELIVVSKTQPVEKIKEAYEAGHRAFGENKVQELMQKVHLLPTDIQWHLIGHLQSNKVKFIAPFIHLIHSIDSIKLLQEVNRQAQKVNRIIPCLLQVHIATEETKFGFSPKEVKQFMTNPETGKLSNISIQGLMGMATFTDQEEQISKEFRKLKSLFDEIKTCTLPNADIKTLSMGMSGDYLLAMEEGSTMVRVGSAIFGERNYAL